MKLVADKKAVQDLLAEVLLEYQLLEADPFAAAEADAEEGGDEGGEADAGAEEGGDKEEKKDDKAKEGGDAMTVKFDASAVKKYNSNTDWRSSEGEVKNISKKGIEVDVDGNNILVNFDDITEHANSFFKKKRITEAEKLDTEDKKEISDLEAAMGNAAKEIGAAFDTAQDEIEQEVEEMPEEELNERKQQLNEALGVTAIIGLVLALPKLVETIAKGVDKLVKLIQKFTKKDPPKTDDEKAAWAAKIIDFTHKWHKVYIKAFYYMLKFSGLYKKAGIKDNAQQMKVAKILYYTVVAGLAVSAGIGAVSAFKAGISQAAHGGEFAIGTLESVMTLVKSGEVAEFLGILGAEAAPAAAAAAT